MRHAPKNKGFVLLIAIVIATILFSIGVGLATVIFKELILAFTARESQRAFYAADTGIECIRYWDNWRGASRFNDTNPFNPGVSRPIECDRSVITPNPSDETPKDFWLNAKDDDRTIYCVHGNVDKPESEQISRVRSWGFNSCDASYTRRIDRAFEALYLRL